MNRQDPLTPEERELARRLAGHDGGGPSAQVDARILQAARDAMAPEAAARPAARPLPQRRGAARHRRWPAALGLAASVTLAIGVAWQLREPPRPQADAALQAEIETPVAAPIREPAASMATAPAPADTASTTGATAPAEASGRARTQASQPPAPGGLHAPAPARSTAPAEAASAATAPTFAEAPAVAMDAAPPMPAADAPARAERMAAPPPPAPPAAPAPSPPRQQAPATPEPLVVEATAEEASKALEAELPLRQLRAAPAPAAAPSAIADAAVEPAPAAAGIAKGAAARPGDEAGRWLQQIREQRDRGDLEGARASLARFVRSHPGVEIPEDLRPLLLHRP